VCKDLHFSIICFVFLSLSLLLNLIMQYVEKDNAAAAHVITTNRPQPIYSFGNEKFAGLWLYRFTPDWFLALIKQTQRFA